MWRAVSYTHLDVYKRQGVDNTEYYAKRKARDDEARAAYRAELEKDDLNGQMCIRDSLISITSRAIRITKLYVQIRLGKSRSEEHTSELQSRQ